MFCCKLWKCVLNQDKPHPQLKMYHLICSLNFIVFHFKCMSLFVRLYVLDLISWFCVMSTFLCCSVLLCTVVRFNQTNHSYSLPPRRLMTRLPLRTVQPLKAWAAVTESTVFRPIHTLGQSPAQGVQLSL